MSISSYPRLNSIFRAHLSYFPYLFGDQYEYGSVLWFIRYLAWPDIIYGCVKFASLTFISSFKIVVLLGDFTWFMGSARFWYLIVCFLWTLIATGVRTICYISIRNKSYQHWIAPITVLETVDYETHNDYIEYTKDYDIEDKKSKDFLAFVCMSTRFTLKFILAFSFFTGWAVNLPILYSFPVEYLPITIINSINTGFHGFLAAAWEVNYSVLLGFYWFYCGYRFDQIQVTFQRSVNSIRSEFFHSERNKSKNPTSSIDYISMVKFQANIISLCIEMKKSRIFWDKVNNIIFTGTFLAETLLLYLMFFANVSGIMLYLVIWLGFLTIFYGQSINILPAIYCQRKHDRCLNQLFHHFVPETSMSINLKIRTLNTLDYLSDHKIFKIFWCFYASSWNYIKIQAEIAMLLLLLIANARS